MARNNQLYNDLDTLIVEEKVERYSSNSIDRLKHHLNTLEILHQQPKKYEEI